MKRLVLAASAFFLIALAVIPAAPAQAAVGDSCGVLSGSDYVPGTYQLVDSVETCTATSSPKQGFSCGDKGYYNGSICVADETTCTADGGVDGTYSNGYCTTSPPTPETPTPGAGFGNVGSIPGVGGTQPMCVNASPFIGYGIGITSGTVLCYTGAGQMMDIKAYSVNGGWNSLLLSNIFAGSTITANGLLSGFGNAQLFSANGNTGLQVSDDTLVLRSQDENGNYSGVLVNPTSTTIATGDANGNLSSVEVEADNITMATTDADGNVSGMKVESDNVFISSTNSDGDGSAVGVTTTGAYMVANSNAGSDAAIVINGTNMSGNTSQTGVLVTGDGNGTNQARNEDGTADWADVMIASKNYELANDPDESVGSAIIVNDYGVNIVSPKLDSSSNAVAQNTFGSGADNGPDTYLTNIIGEAGAGTVTNNIGTGVGTTINVMGNTTATTTVSMYAGTSATTMINGSAATSVSDGDSVLTSALPPNRQNPVTPVSKVSSASTITMKDTDATYTDIDSKGRITLVNGTAPEASSSFTLTNGAGNTNGVAITENKTTTSGGTYLGSSLTLADNGATFSRVTDGAPVRVHGVQDGVDAYDAVNVRQLDSGLAAVAALSSLPTPRAGKLNSFGIGMSRHGSGTGVAVGGQSELDDNISLKYGLSAAMSPIGVVSPTASVGLGISW